MKFDELLNGTAQLEGASVPPTVMVSSGPPLVGYSIEEPTTPHQHGSLRISGPSVVRQDGTHGVLDTGDVGFVDEDGWLYVSGRSDDHLVIRGRNHSAALLETAVSGVRGIRDGRVAAVQLATGEWAVLAEVSRRGDGERVIRREIERIAARIIGSTPDHILLAGKGTVPLTASGKLRRPYARAIAQALVTKGELSPS